MTIVITAYPYAIQNGTLDVPNELTKDQIEGYILDHWNDICFGEPDLDYENTDFDFYEEGK